MYVFFALLDKKLQGDLVVEKQMVQFRTCA
jgi:hypothetical protein